MPTFDNNLFTEAQNSFQQASGAALPSPESLDTASARVRSRVEGRQRALDQQTGARFAQSGGANTGGLGAGRRNNTASTQGAFATGLADLEEGFLEKQQQGAGILSQIGQGQGQLGSLFGNLEIGREGVRQGDERLDLERLFGQQRLDNEGRAIDETIEQRKANTLIDFFQNFGAIGNTRFFNSNAEPGTDPLGESLQDDFARLISGLFGSIGLSQ